MSMIAAAALGACGGGETGPGPQVPSGSVGTTPPTGTETAPTGTTTGTGTAPTPPTGSTAATPPPAVGPMNPIKASAMGDELKALGLDPKKLPPLAKMEPEKLRQVMKTITKAVGGQCTTCHDANDFRAWTPNKKVASHMWNDWVRGLTMEDGSVLYCDSCHQGHLKFLDRKDKKELSKWMDANFVSKLKRLDKKEHGCETCHGDPFDPKFLDKWEKENVPAKK
jgi:hypothetical protein